MRRFSQRRMRTLMALCCALTFSMLVLSCTLGEPSLYFFRVVVGLSDSSCACSRCISHLNPQRDEDGWFMERFNESFKPLLSRSNSFISDDTYRWWQWLQAEKNPSNLSSVLDRLFQLIPADEHYDDGGPHRCRICSVVGNSGNLWESHYGSDIDASDFVIR